MSQIDTNGSAGEIIQSLRRGQEAILGVVTQTQAVARDFSRARKHLRAVCELLPAHWQRQTNMLQSWIQPFYADDRQAQKHIEFLAHDLKELKVAYLIFTDKYIATPQPTAVDIRNFPMAFTEFARKITARMDMEEQYLFPLIEKMPK